MKRILIALILIIAMSSTATALVEEGWAHERQNVAMEGIEYAYWDFEEGSNCKPLQNQHPEIATFLDVPTSSYAPIGYGSCTPSYVTKDGSSCGNTRCYMRIYPWCGYVDGEPLPWVYIVNGNAAFSPVTCCESSDCWLGECYPGFNAHITFKPDTHYISFLACTGYSIKVRLYDRRGNTLHYAKITKTIDRVGKEPSNWTRFEMHMPDKEIDSMRLSGSLNDWHIDDLIVGGEQGYLDEPVDYTYVAELAEQLHGVWWCEHALGFDYEDFTYAEPFQFQEYLEFWNPETKQFESDQGISNPGLILWAYNHDSEELAGTSFVKQITPAKMMKHDFKDDVDSADTQPGDVYFMDYLNTRDGVAGQDGVADFIGMVVPETPTGMNLIASQPDLANDPIGVIYSKKSIVESSPAFMGYKRLPGAIRGGKNPIPKGH